VTSVSCVACSDLDPNDCCIAACDNFQCVNKPNSSICQQKYGSGFLCTDQCKCVQISWPDLVITDIWNESDGTIHYTIKNEGNADAGPSTSSLEIYEEGNWKVNDTDYVGSLSARGSSPNEYFANFNLNTYCEEHPGEEVNLRVCADKNDDVVESSEDKIIIV